LDVQNLWQDLNGEKMKSVNKSRQIQVTDGGSHPLGLLCSSRTSPDQYISLMKKLLKYPSLKVDVSKMPVSKAVWKQFGQKGDQFRDIRRKQAEILLRLNCYSDMSVYCDSCRHWETNPDPEHFVSYFSDFSISSSLKVLFPLEETLVCFDPDTLQMVFFCLEPEMMERIKMLAISENCSFHMDGEL
jgi:hypothetical protein